MGIRVWESLVSLSLGYSAHPAELSAHHFARRVALLGHVVVIVVALARLVPLDSLVL